MNVLGEKNEEDAYAYHYKDKSGIILEQNQTDTLKKSIKIRYASKGRP